MAANFAALRFALLLTLSLHVVASFMDNSVNATANFTGLHEGGNSTSSKMFLSQRHLESRHTRCCLGYRDQSEEKAEPRLPWKCIRCDCHDLDDRIGQDNLVGSSGCPDSPDGPWKQLTADKLCVRRLFPQSDVPGFGHSDHKMRFQIRTWFEDRVVIPWTDYFNLDTNDEVCIGSHTFEEVSWLQSGARLKIVLRAKFPRDGVGRKKKATRDFLGTFVYVPSSDAKTLKCYPNRGHVKHPNCKVYSCYRHGGQEHCDELPLGH
jgi:hypothetical protein